MELNGAGDIKQKEKAYSNIMKCDTCRIYGLRKYKKKIKEDDTL